MSQAAPLFSSGVPRGNVIQPRCSEQTLVHRQKETWEQYSTYGFPSLHGDALLVLQKIY